MKARGFSQYTVSGAMKIASASSAVITSPPNTIFMPGIDGLDAESSLFGIPTPPPSGFRTILTSVTGTQNNYAPGISGNTIEYWSGASDVTITGLASGYRGQIYIFKNIGTNNAFFLNQSASSSAGNKLTNIVTSGNGTPVAPRGHIWYQYDGTDWQLIEHNQGAWINQVYAGTDFTAAGTTWTVDLGDLITFKYWLSGAFLYVTIEINTSSVGATVTNILNIKIPGGFTATALAYGLGNLAYNDAGAGFISGGLLQTNGPSSTSAIQVLKSGLAAWNASVNTTAAQGSVAFEVS